MPTHPSSDGAAPAAARIGASDRIDSEASGPVTFELRIGDICARVARGCPEALADLYNARFAHVYRTAVRITGRDEAFGLDAAQETFLRIIASRATLARITTASDLDRWLTRVVHTAAIDLLRAERRRAARERRRLSAEAHDAGALLDRIEWIRHSLRELDHADRELLELRARGHTLDQIAGATGSTAPAAHGRIRRALAKLSRRPLD